MHCTRSMATLTHIQYYSTIRPAYYIIMHSQHLHITISPMSLHLMSPGPSMSPGLPLDLLLNLSTSLHLMLLSLLPGLSTLLNLMSLRLLFSLSTPLNLMSLGLLPSLSALFNLMSPSLLFGLPTCSAWSHCIMSLGLPLGLLPTSQCRLAQCRHSVFQHRST